MENSTKIQILKGFRLYLHWLEAYNYDISPQNDWLSIARRAFDVLFATVNIFILPVHIAFDVWHLIDNRTDMKRVVTLFPLIISSTQIWMSFIIMFVKKPTIIEMIDRLQRIVDQRKLFSHYFFEGS